MVVGATQTKFLFFVKFAVVHAVGVVLASVFAFFAVFSVMGLLMAALPPRAFKRFSAYIRGVVVVYLVTLLCTSFAVPDAIRRAKDTIPSWAYLMPSCWFLGLCQSLRLRDRAGPVLIGLSRLALPGVAAVVGIALCAYAIGYQRHFMRIAEIADTTATRPQSSNLAAENSTGPLGAAHSIPARLLPFCVQNVAAQRRHIAWF